MLRIPVQKKWWKMEYDGEKPEDYREIGNPKWGAEPGKEYYVLPLLTVRRIR